MGYIKGIYSSTIFNNEDNGYTVGLLKVLETDIEFVGKNITFVGNFFDLKLKSTYLMHGEITTHNKYGEQFLVSDYELVLPTKEDEVVEFLSSELFPIGEKTAQKIVDAFKENTLDVILNSPSDLQVIPRLSEDKITKIHNVLVEYQSTSNIVLELSKMGFSTKNCLTILNRYKNNALDIVNNNIYDLVNELDFRFTDIDTIAMNNGVSIDDDRRISSLIIYIINEITFDKGDTYLLLEDIYNEIVKYVPNIDLEKLEYMIIKLNKEGKIRIDHDRYYLSSLYDSEKYIVDKIYYLNNLERNNLPKLEKKIDELEYINDITYDESQRKAIIKSLNNNFTIITGGPGTGKTTIIKAIVSLLKNIYKISDNDIALLAPTGRAAKKLMETTLIPGYTIHRYLGWDKERNTFSSDIFNPRTEKYVIIDEVSMIDTILFSALLKGCRKDAKYILVGDYYQLPSVSQGQVLKDLIDSDVLDVVKLNTLYRQNEESYIVNLANEIKEKELSESFIHKKADYNFIECDPSLVVGAISDIVKIATTKGYTEKDIQVLAPMYKTINGIDNLNIILQSIFNPKDDKKKELAVGNVIYRENDKILQLVNDPDNNVYNGDIGYIKKVIPAKKSSSNKNEIIVNFDGNEVTYTPDKFINITHGYAISVHKSQGGEFKMVIMPVVNSFKRMLYNKLVYTAVTRAKKTLILVGDRQSFLYGVKNDYVENRRTTLKEFLIDKYN